MCRRRRDARPSRGAGPGRLRLPGSFILNLGLLHPRAPAGAERGIRDGGTLSGHNPLPESGPPRDSRAPAASARGWSERLRRPAPRTRTPQPHPSPGRGPSPSRSQGAAWKPRSPPLGCPTTAGSISAPPPQCQTSLPAAASPSPRSLGPPSTDRRKRGAPQPGPPSGQEQSWQPEAGLGGYLNNPAGQPGHLVRSQVRPLV